MAGKYRALLIGNSTYPADDHNLQPLKGPVKDIAAVNHALTDPASGLFDDLDVALIAETTSVRALRALGRFFGSADRDDVLLVYFSGHGKLDQSGRLHLCMQDTETTDLLSTAVSSTRINEFAEASRARNVAIVLDCCYAGAFRGGDFGETVAGPGRYVLTSCRGTQLANDATVENGTSYFTQHLVDGLLGAAADRDEDGYVDFSDLYSYIDGKLRAEGKQIPQRRVTGDGDLRLARRAVAASDVRSSAPADDQRAGEPPAAVPLSRPNTRRAGSSRRRGLIVAAAGVVVAGTVIAVIAANNGGDGSGAPPTADPTLTARSYDAAGPWRLKMVYDINRSHAPGCSAAYVDPDSGKLVRLIDAAYDTAVVQVHQAGNLVIKVSDPGCLVAPMSGSGFHSLPNTFPPLLGDTDAFPAGGQITVHIVDFSDSSECRLRLTDPTTGLLVDSGTANAGHDTVVFNASGAKTAYLSRDGCGVRVLK